jgi:hypothetical protein
MVIQLRIFMALLFLITALLAFWFLMLSMSLVLVHMLTGQSISTALKVSKAQQVPQVQLQTLRAQQVH